MLRPATEFIDLAAKDLGVRALNQIVLVVLGSLQKGCNSHLKRHFTFDFHLSLLDPAPCRAIRTYLVESRLATMTELSMGRVSEC